MSQKCQSQANRSRQCIGRTRLSDICVCFADYGVNRGPFAGSVELQVPDDAIEIQGLDDVVMIPQRLN